MAVAIARVSGADYNTGNKRVRVRDLTFSGNYATNGETINAADVGLRKIETATFSGNVAAGSTPTSANPVGVILSSSGTSAAVRLYELGGTGAAGDPLAEKTNAEAYLAGQTIRVRFEGF